jgi:putative colanic acid biosynthesis UDP-glucose lipid carrier transferase
LINVLRSDMSLVGPRPHAVGHDHLWLAAVAGYEDRFRARPGLTGLAQVLGYRGVIASMACIEKRVAADNAYIDSWSFGGDLLLILRTVPVLFGDDAAV